MGPASNDDSSVGGIEVQIKDPDLVVHLEVDHTHNPGEWVAVELLGRSEQLATTFPISITFFVAPENIGPDEHDRILTIPATPEERNATMGCRIRITEMAMRALLALISSGHRRTFNFSAVPEPKGHGLLIENFEFHLEPRQDPRSIH